MFHRILLLLLAPFALAFGGETAGTNGVSCPLLVSDTLPLAEAELFHLSRHFFDGERAEACSEAQVQTEILRLGCKSGAVYAVRSSINAIDAGNSCFRVNVDFYRDRTSKDPRYADNAGQVLKRSNAPVVLIGLGVVLVILATLALSAMVTGPAQ